MSEEAHTYEGCGEDAAAYVLGALSEAEHDAFRAHLEGCAACREEVSALQAVTNSLPAAAPQVAAPAPLRDRVMSTVRAEAGLRSALASHPAGRRRSRRYGRESQRLPWWLVAGSALASAGAVVLVLLVMGAGSGSNGATRLYHAQVTAPAAKVTLRVSSGHGTLQIANMPQTAPGKVYEVWLKRSGAAQPTDALFTVSSSGAATVGVPGDLHGVKVVMVTTEPRGGSRVPTSTPVIVANLS